jgi:hypothetical protein
MPSIDLVGLRELFSTLLIEILDILLAYKGPGVLCSIRGGSAFTFLSGVLGTSFKNIFFFDGLSRKPVEVLCYRETVGRIAGGLTAYDADERK